MPHNIILGIVVLAISYFIAFAVIDIVRQLLNPMIKIKSFIHKKIFINPEFVMYIAKRLYKAENALEIIYSFICKYMLALCIALSFIDRFELYEILFRVPKITDNFIYLKNIVLNWIIVFFDMDREIVITVLFKLAVIIASLLFLRFIYATLKVSEVGKLAANYLEKAEEEKIKLLMELLLELADELVVLCNKCTSNYLAMYGKRLTKTKNKIAKARQIFYILKSLNDLNNLQEQVDKVYKIICKIDENKLGNYYRFYYSDFTILYRLNILTPTDFLKRVSCFDTLLDCNEISKLHDKVDKSYQNFEDLPPLKYMKADFESEKVEKDFIEDADYVLSELEEYYWNTYEKVLNINRFLKLDKKIKRNILYYSSSKALLKSQAIFRKLSGQ